MVRESVQYAAETRLETGTNTGRRREIRFADPRNVTTEELAAIATVLNVPALFHEITRLLENTERNEANE